MTNKCLSNWAYRSTASRLNLPHNFHASRHFYASMLIERGVSIPVVSKLLGHSSPAITLSLYAWCVVDPTEHDIVLDALDNPPKKDEGSAKVAPR
ncbi:tyrosine-type recombinase/integrase [uncultured Ruegeria sp.]|uniref:tyrosine-type recombinase/integrase n=1 Tax=uncultured Ruegeria sp. TaxID=259304 RepID=UPI0034295858